MLASGVEMPLELQTGLMKPNDRFFLCHAEPTPVVEAQGWSHGVEGSAVIGPLDLWLADLQAMEQVTLRAVIECTGNQRQLFEDVLDELLNRRLEETELRWALGGVGTAHWSGVHLRDVLGRAGIADTTCHVMPISIDASNEEPDGICDPLPADHGFPARLITPVWVWTYSIKWLDRIEVTREHHWVAHNTQRYVMMGEAWADRDMEPCTRAPDH